jgi:hypothetical protein
MHLLNQFAGRVSSAARGHREATMPSSPEQACGAWLRGFVWDHYVTLTAAGDLSPARLRREFIDVFVRRLARRAQRPICWFYVIERGGVGGPAHVHALVAGTARLTTHDIALAWKLGHTRILCYDAARGAAYYVAKRLGEWTDYDISSRRPPARRELPSENAAGRGAPAIASGADAFEEFEL